ncbi:IpaB/EvcA family protein [Furfurilactobacillus sp. WILCCON 0119]|uniref:IpaB/EvcA family protein n=1 Tax=Furfurilactobacillus entadae TaxID=2922307 RepID=UPI0035ECBFAD
MADIKLTPAVQALLDQVNDLFPGTVMVQFGDHHAGYVRDDQVQQHVLKDRLLIWVDDITAPQYSAAHELTHLLLLLQGFPQVYFNLTLGDEALDTQLMALTTQLYNIANHMVIFPALAGHDLIDDTVKSQYYDGIFATVEPETGKRDDDQNALRLLVMLDALVFFGDAISDHEDELQTNFPLTFAAAQKLFATITEKPVTSPFGMRRALVKLFKAFDDQLTDWGLPALNSTAFTSVTSVLSDRQLRLEVRQLFEVFHSDLQNKATGERAYVGLNRSDRQNAFVLTPPAQADDEGASYFKGIYDMTVKDFLEQQHIAYSVRD